MRDIIESSLPSYLWRYLKPSIVTGATDETAFDLRVDPPEKYVSMWEGTGADYLGVGTSALSNMRERMFVKKNGRLLSINLEQVEQEINFPTPLVAFRPQNRPHFGMHYLTHEQFLILEVQTMLEASCPVHTYDAQYKLLPIK